MTQDARTSVTTVPVMGRIMASTTAGGLDIYAGAAAGVAIAEIGIESDDIGHQLETQLRPAARILAGAELPVGARRVVFELGFMHAGVDAAGVSGNVGGADISVGYALDVAR